MCLGSLVGLASPNLLSAKKSCFNLKKWPSNSTYFLKVKLLKCQDKIERFKLFNENYDYIGKSDLIDVLFKTKWCG